MGVAPQAPGAVQRTFSILWAVARAENGLTLSEISRSTALPHSTVHRFLQELLDLELVVRNSRKRYTVGLRVFELGINAPVQKALREAALPVMEDLYEVTHANIHLGVLDGTDTLLIQQISGRGSAESAGSFGARLPVHATANGKVLLAFSPSSLMERTIAAGLTAFTASTITDQATLRAHIEDVRRLGYAVAREERTHGTVSIAAPVLRDPDTAIASLSIVFHSSKSDVLKFVPAVRMGAATIARRWRGSRFAYE